MNPDKKTENDFEPLYLYIEDYYNPRQHEPEVIKDEEEPVERGSIIIDIF